MVHFCVVGTHFCCSNHIQFNSSSPIPTVQTLRATSCCCSLWDSPPIKWAAVHGFPPLLPRQHGRWVFYPELVMSPVFCHGYSYFHPIVHPTEKRLWARHVTLITRFAIVLKLWKMHLSNALTCSSISPFCIHWCAPVLVSFRLQVRSKSVYLNVYHQ